MNKAILIGNLTRDPETRTTASGVTMCQFTIAVNRRFVNQQGVREADFIPIVTWRQTAELCSRYLSKGTKVAIEGKLRWSQWERDGQKRSKLEVIVDEIEFMNSRPAASPAAAVDGGQQYAVPEAPAVEVADEDIPF